jgi:hypothetical protein
VHPIRRKPAARVTIHSDGSAALTSSRRLYLAYGSNLSRAQLAARCPQAVPVAAVTIHGWRLAFFGAQTERWGYGGVATLLPDADAIAYGALYELNAGDEQRMDGFEGLPGGVYSKNENFAQHLPEAILPLGDIVFCYLKVDTSLPNAPSGKYIATIRAGYRDWDLPLATIAGVASQP